MSGWTIGFIVGAAVVVVVVILLVAMIVLARRINGTAHQIVAGLHDTRDNTAGLWAVGAVNASAARIVTTAGDLRTTLEARGGEQ